MHTSGFYLPRRSGGSIFLVYWLQRVAQSLVDAVMAVLPRRCPDPAELKRAKLVSHRGEHDNSEVLENTLAAFRQAEAAGVWGVEADIRWTADLVPVIVHDPDTARVFGRRCKVAEHSFDALRKSFPLLPSLAELVQEFGGSTHLMLELKAEPFPDLPRQREILRRHLAGLEPRSDYHLLALEDELFELFDIQPRRCCLPVAELNTRALSQVALKSGYGGLTGHYLLLGQKTQQRHEVAGQRVGTGFVRSRNSLYREINRGVEWVFSNHAVALQGLLNDAERDPGR